MQVKMTIKRDADTDKFVVHYYEDGKHSEPKTYYTDDIHDARKTMCDSADNLVAKQGFKVDYRTPHSVVLSKYVSDKPFYVTTDERHKTFDTKEAAQLFIELHCTYVPQNNAERLISTNAYD